MGAPRKALVVEDHPDARALVRTYLLAMGLEVVDVAEGRSAIRILKVDRPDLVCLDLMLPELSGFEVCEFMRAEPRAAGRADPGHERPGQADGPRLRRGGRGDGVSGEALQAQRVQPRGRPVHEARGAGARRCRDGGDPARSSARIRTSSSWSTSLSSGTGCASSCTRCGGGGVVAFTALLTLGATGALLLVLPRTYHVDAQLLTQRNTVMPALGNPGRTVPTDANVPTRAAAETVLRHDNLLSLMKQTDLLNRWERDRSPVLRLKDWVVKLVASSLRGGPGQRDGGFAGEQVQGHHRRIHRHHRHRLAERAAGLRPGGQRAPELPRAAPLGRGLQHRRDHRHPREPRRRPARGDRHRDGGPQAGPESSSSRPRRTLFSRCRAATRRRTRRRQRPPR